MTDQGLTAVAIAAAISLVIIMWVATGLLVLTAQSFPTSSAGLW